MQKTILITGATDGIGYETAKILVSMGHTVLLHGRNQAKLTDTQRTFSELPGGGQMECYTADLADMQAVSRLVQAVTAHHTNLDVLINNAGVFTTNQPITSDGLDVRFVVNTLAPYLLTNGLLPLLGANGRVVNLSSAAQAPVNVRALTGDVHLDDWGAYSQSKLAITAWSRSMGLAHKETGPVIVSVNPGSMLNTKMVQKAFGVAGGDVRTGANILVRASLADEFTTAQGMYFDNDSGQFANPHPDALDASKTEKLIEVMEDVLAKIAQ